MAVGLKGLAFAGCVCVRETERETERERERKRDGSRAQVPCVHWLCMCVYVRVWERELKRERERERDGEMALGLQSPMSTGNVCMCV